ncbi:outer membrane protein assembly factor BamE domain-containing protein [Mucilaginibacter sp. UYCu711]|uniref:outer membrane protein assembly factor BamE domain-containing protein n=1 Tax=Mucilaginibacter sp. UYCu711 TaxID=3156339 RepID=UPI003D1B2154
MFYYQAVDFEKQRWVARPGKRYEMSANIIKSHMLIGKTKDQVKALLGKDDSNSNNSHSNTWFYYLGIIPGFAIDPDMLYIEFNNGKVAKVRQDPG